MKFIITNKGAIISSALFVFVFLLSLYFYFFVQDPWHEYVFFFPTISGNQIVGEERCLPVRKATQSNLELMVSEFILGPASIDLVNGIPQKTKLRALLYRDKVLYIDFSNDLVLQRDSVPLSFDESIKSLKKTIFFNYRMVDEIFIFIEGQMPKTGV